MTTYGCDHHALILGGSCELAIALAQVMAVKGLCPMLTYRDRKGRAVIDASLKDIVGKYQSVQLDLAEIDSWSDLNQVLSGGVGYLVDFAHGDFEGLVASADTSAVAAYFEANIANRTQVIQNVSRAMISRRKGRMLYVSSAAAGRPNPGQGFYAAVKQASEAIYRNVGLELAPRGITTVTLRPGYVDAGRGRRYLEGDDGGALSRVPIGRALEIGEVVDTIMFLLSDSAVGINATNITIDGGLSSVKSPGFGAGLRSGADE